MSETLAAFIAALVAYNGSSAAIINVVPTSPSIIILAIVNPVGALQRIRFLFVTLRHDRDLLAALQPHTNTILSIGDYKNAA
jgi:hypothetical protein